MMGNMMDRLLEQVLQRLPASQTTPPTATVEERTPVVPTNVPPTRADRAKFVTIRSAQPPTEKRRLPHFQGQTSTPRRHYPESQVLPVIDSDEENEVLFFTALEDMALQHEAAASRHPASGPFTIAVHDIPFPPGLQMPNFNLYDRTTNPEDHVNTFEIKMKLYNVEDAILCRAFPSTFTRAARQWAYIQIPGLSGEVAVVALQTGLLPGLFINNLTLKPPRNFGNRLHRARNYMALEDQNRSGATLEGSNSVA
ncbi:hypothetical protein Droror1_Dr00024562 [Drosera rotundifolia]